MREVEVQRKGAGVEEVLSSWKKVMLDRRAMFEVYLLLHLKIARRLPIIAAFRLVTSIKPREMCFWSRKGINVNLYGMDPIFPDIQESPASSLKAWNYVTSMGVSNYNYYFP